MLEDIIQLINVHLATEALLNHFAGGSGSSARGLFADPQQCSANRSVASVTEVSVGTWFTVVLAVIKASFAHELERQSNTGET